MSSCHTTNSRVQPYACKSCLKKFNNPGALTQHCKSTRHGYPCTISGCARVFTLETARQQHLDSSLHKDKAVDIGTEATVRNQVVAIASPRTVKTSCQSQNQSKDKQKRGFARTSHMESVTPAGERKTESVSAHKPNINTDTRWSRISPKRRALVLSTLASRCHSTDLLHENGYPEDPSQLVALGVTTSPMEENIRKSPPRHYTAPKRDAVVIDCEMIGVRTYKEVSELARVSAIDYLTGELLIDSLVQPTKMVMNWRTKFSGITKSMMQTAVAEGRALQGWQAARAELWKFVDAETIIVGHAAKHDLGVLRLSHDRIVDSGILAKEAVGPGVKLQWGLKTLCCHFLGLQIQNGNAGHDSVEDALATREVVLWCTSHEEELAGWGVRQKEDWLEKTAERRKEAQRRRAAKDARAARASPCSTSRAVKYTDMYYDGFEVWDDIAVDFGWPHPNTGYDPWSD